MYIRFKWVLDCKRVAFFFLKISKEIGRAWRAREPHTPVGERKLKTYSLSPVSISVFSLVPDLFLFDCLRVLEHAKIRTVLQSKWVPICLPVIVILFYVT